MKIRTEHFNLGSALIQIAADDSFTAINPLRLQGKKINNAFLINTDTCVFLKYGQEPKQTGEYQFTFTTDHLQSMYGAEQHYRKIFIGLVCVEDQEICCLDIGQLKSMIEARIATAGNEEDSYQILVKVPEGKSLRAYANAAGRRGMIAGQETIISRSRFPGCLFE
ncbi:hypothetical protein D3C78_1259010 [compost metagenome]